LSLVNKVGIAATVGAGACFISNDALVKHVSAQLASAQLIFIRGVFAVVTLGFAGWFLFKQKDYRALLHPMVYRRALVDSLATLCYLTALAYLPLGNATAINMAAPIFIAAGAGLFYREKITASRWLLILLGFAGVLLVIQPRAEGLNQFAWLCLLATVLHAMRDLMTRAISVEVPSFVVTMATALSVTLFAGACSIYQGWKPITQDALLSLALASMFLSVAYFLMVKSMRAGDMAVIAPFRYSSLPFALLLGYVVWGDVPNALAWIGIGLLLVSGLLMMRRKAPV
jgi:drug/metabolite transporter (DMT)-like permease